MTIPLYYLLDENPVAGPGEAGDFTGYTAERISVALRGFRGVLCTSAHLAEFVRGRQLHPTVHEVTLVFDEMKLVKLQRNWRETDAKEIRIGIIGRLAATDELLAALSSALRRAHEHASLSVLIDAGVEHSVLPFVSQWIESSPSLDEFLTRWKPHAPDILIHTRGSFDQASPERDQLLLIARYLDAVPIVGTNVKALESDVLKACDPAARANTARWLEAYCSTTFAADRTLQVLTDIEATGSPVDAVTWVTRLRKMVEFNSHRVQRTETRAARAEAELASKAYRLALRVRKLASLSRQVARWMRLR